MSKRDFGSIKSLVHFDFPYFNEPNDGLDDDVGIEAWSKENSNVALWGSVIPKAGTQAPKFGYRCLYPYFGSAVCSNNTGIWNLNSSKDYEIEFFVYPKAHGGFRFLLRDTDNSFSISLDTSGYIVVAIPAWGIDTATTSTALVTGGWRHILLRVSNNTLKVFINGTETLSQPLTPSVELSLNNMRLGYFSSTSYPLFIDEFVFRHSAGSEAPAIPTRPYSGRLDIDKVGGYEGYGTIDSGSLTVSSDMTLNTYGIINGITDAKSFSVSSWSNGSYTATAGCEVLIHITAPKSTSNANYPLVGLYAFAKVAELDGNNVTLSKEITTANGYDFTLDSSLLDTYYVQAIVVPRFSSLTVNSSKTINPLTWGTSTGGGIVAFRVTGDCTINGSILTHGKGAIRYDYQQVTNSKLIDRFLCSQGGGIFISCGGTLTISSTARLGASWSGAGDGSNGAAGYGGKGGDANPISSVNVAGGAGGVGGGGGGAACYSTSQYAKGGAVGANGSDNDYRAGGGGGSGGNGGSATNTNYGIGGSGGGGQGNSGGSGGTGPKANGYKANNLNGGRYGFYSTTFIHPSGAGGGATGGNGGSGYAYSPSSNSGLGLSNGIAGASIILIAKKLNANTAALSTGGSAGNGGSYGIGKTATSGGGGTGFCYIACEGQVS